MSELDIERELAAADASEMHWYDKFRRVEAENAALRQQLANAKAEVERLQAKNSQLRLRAREVCGE